MRFVLTIVLLLLTNSLSVKAQLLSKNLDGLAPDLNTAFITKEGLHPGHSKLSHPDIQHLGRLPRISTIHWAPSALYGN